MEVMNAQMDQYDKVLGDLEDRDEEIYRSVYGMNSIPSEIREAGLGGVNRYARLEDLDRGSELRRTVLRRGWIRPSRWNIRELPPSK